MCFCVIKACWLGKALWTASPVKWQVRNRWRSDDGSGLFSAQRREWPEWTATETHQWRGQNPYGTEQNWRYIFFEISRMRPISWGQARWVCLGCDCQDCRKSVKWINGPKRVEEINISILVFFWCLDVKERSTLSEENKA